MKKTTCFVLLGALAIAFALPVTLEAARGGNGKKKGAAKAALRPTGGGQKVGDVICNTTPKGLLKVLVKVKDGQPETEYDVAVTVNGVGGVVGTLTTKRNGKRNARFRIDLDSSVYPAETIDVEVTLTPPAPPVEEEPQVEDAGGGYETGNVTVPLKPLRGVLPEPEPEPEP